MGRGSAVGRRASEGTRSRTLDWLENAGDSHCELQTLGKSTPQVLRERRPQTGRPGHFAQEEAAGAYSDTARNCIVPPPLSPLPRLSFCLALPNVEMLLASSASQDD